MGRRWRLLLGVAIVLVIVIWDVGLPGHGSSTDQGARRPPATRPVSVAALWPVALRHIPGLLQPVGEPEFDANFTGSALDKSVWDTCYPYMSQAGCQNFGNTAETEWYLPTQVKVRDDMLQLVAERRPTTGTTVTGAPKEYDCRSGMVTSHPGFNFEYGYVQAVARIPSNPGLWSAIWLDPSNYQWPPEMDIIENWGYAVNAGSFFHPYPKGTTSDKGEIKPFQRATGWHTFALSWTPKQMTFLMDGRVTLTVRKRVPHLKMYLIADLADFLPIGGANQCSGSLLISSIEVWKR